MRRREFITLLGGAAAAWPFAARAQQPNRLRRIGVLIPIAQPIVQQPVSAFLRELHDFGWTEDGNVRIDYRWSSEEADAIQRYAAELVSLRPNVILAHGGPVLRAIQKATRTIPIVFVQVSNPVEAGFVGSLAHPGGNTTGFTNFEQEVSGKWLELLREVAPNLSRVLLLTQAQMNPSFNGYFRVINSAATSFGVQLVTASVSDAPEAVEAINTFARGSNGGLIVLPSPLSTNNVKLIVELSAKHFLPAMYPFRFFAESGGLMSYGSDTVDLYRRAALYVDRILKGTNPADLPVQQPTRYQLAINLKTARRLGLNVSPKLLSLADNVIE